MPIVLSGPVIRNASAADFDMRQMKKALNRLGYYQPAGKTGITAIPDAALFAGLAHFQTDHSLPPTGNIHPDDETLTTLNTALAHAPDGYYIWRTVADGKVRPAHAQYEGTVRSWQDMPDPGEDYNCRCWAQTAEPGLNSVYPELILIPLYGSKILYNLWRIWLYKQNTNWILGDFKSPTKWGNQMRDRDWTPDQITQTIQYGKNYPAPNKVYPENTATRYEYKDRFVVRDDKTRKILQISRDKDFTPNVLE